MNAKPELTYLKIVQTTSVNLDKEGCSMTDLCKRAGKEGACGFPGQ